MNPTTITLLTPRGRGAVATLRFEGDGKVLDSFFTAANGKAVGEQSFNRIVFGQWGQEVPEDVVLCRVEETVTEIHCHGGEVAAGRIQRDLESQGSRRETWPEMLERTEGPFLREWTEAVTQATTGRTARILLKQRDVFPQAIRKLQKQIATGVASTKLTADIDAILRWAEFGKHLTRPWNVVLGGPPNAGKSSLINALVGYARAIVYDQPGTTRDVVTAETAFEGWPILLADTAGLREEAEPLEAEGIHRAKTKLASADCPVVLIDVSRPASETDRQLREEFPKALFVAHKCDLPPADAQNIPRGAWQVSSLTGEGVEELLEKIVARLIPEIPGPDQPIPFTDRQTDLLTQALEATAKGDAPAARMRLDAIFENPEETGSPNCGRELAEND